MNEIDALFALPLAEFTAARNALAARWKKEGRAEEAQRVKALAKPSATAWAVNQLYWRHRREFDRLLAVNEKVRDAQLARSGDLRTLLEKRRTMISELAAVAEELLSEAGHAASLDARRRVITTLETLTVRDRATIEVEAGRLTADLEPLGFDAVAELLAAAPPAKAKVLDFRKGAKEKQVKEKQKAEADRAARARAEAIEKAEVALENARREAARAEAAASEAAARREALEQEKQKLESRLTAAIEQARTATEEVKKTARAVADAERALARAREKS